MPDRIETRETGETVAGRWAQLSPADRRAALLDAGARVYVDATQLAALNEGRLGIVQQNGRYLVVNQAIAEQVRAIDAHLLALLFDPQAAAADDGVPDDLMW